jgi:translocator protein
MRIPIESSTTYRGRNSRPNWLTLLGFVGLAFAAGALGAIFSPAHSPAAAAWYAALSKPTWVAPDRLLGPIWAVLYVLMGAAVWLISRERYHRRRAAGLAAWTVQLLLNALWAPLFFGARNIGAGLFVIIALWLAIIWTIREFSPVRPLAAWLMAPYAIWAGFAMTLNFSIWRLNQ